MDAIETLSALFTSGDAITENLAATYERDGIAHGRRVLTADEFAAVSAHANTLPSTPANNVWD